MAHFKKLEEMCRDGSIPFENKDLCDRYYEKVYSKYIEQEKVRKQLEETMTYITDNWKKFKRHKEALMKDGYDLSDDEIVDILKEIDKQIDEKLGTSLPLSPSPPLSPPPPPLPPPSPLTIMSELSSLSRPPLSAAEKKRARAARNLGGGKSNKKKRKSLRKKRKTTKKKRKSKKR